MLNLICAYHSLSLLQESFLDSLDIFFLDSFANTNLYLFNCIKNIDSNKINVNTVRYNILNYYRFKSCVNEDYKIVE